jgi:hypothetical protein
LFHYNIKHASYRQSAFQCERHSIWNSGATNSGVCWYVWTNNWKVIHAAQRNDSTLPHAERVVIRCLCIY